MASRQPKGLLLDNRLMAYGTRHASLYDDENDEDLKAAINDLSLRSQRKEIRRELTDPYNRLHSIAADADYVESVSGLFPDFPLVANLRCGLWYTNPENPQTVKEAIYFKSIDGHYGEWSFSFRRPNLRLLDLVQRFNGAILVDSTRRGKSFPDALSKTVPIWCAVMNRAACIKYPDLGWTEDEVHTPPSSVSASERSQIRARLDGWATQLAASSYTLPRLRLPLRPVHISPSSDAGDIARRLENEQKYLPVICLSASRCTSGGSSERQESYNYVPGSGDDHETWAPNDFTPAMFWSHRQKLLHSSREELPNLLDGIVRLSKEDMVAESALGKGEIFWVGVTGVGFSLSPLENRHSSGTLSLVISEALKDTEGQSPEGIIKVHVPSGSKKHLQSFTDQMSSISSHIRARFKDDAKLVLSLSQNTANNRDFAVGIALTALSQYFDDHQHRSTPERAVHPSKGSIQLRLEWIVGCTGGLLNPSKGILKRVNTHLMSTVGNMEPLA